MSKPRPTGKIWRHKKEGYLVNVMAFADGWVMARRKGCTPFLLLFKKLQAEYEQAVR